MGAMLAKDHVANAFGPGSHASTFGGTPLVTAACHEVLRTLTQEKIVERCQNVGTYFKDRLLGLKQRHKNILDVRGRGLLLGMKLNIDGEPVVVRCMEKGFLINCIQGNILRFVPPLIIKKTEIDNLVMCLDEILPA
jgi:acetylornithine/succinyldiaminopimelate/putrescine aminotransferase